MTIKEIEEQNKAARAHEREQRKLEFMRQFVLNAAGAADNGLTWEGPANGFRNNVAGLVNMAEEAFNLIEPVVPEKVEDEPVPPIYTSMPKTTDTGVSVGQTWRHKKRGKVYEVIGVGRMQTEDWRRSIGPDWTDDGTYTTVDLNLVVIYQAPGELEPWVRPLWEFLEGHFELLEGDDVSIAD